MLRFHIITLFPQLFSNFAQYGLIARAISEDRIQLHIDQLRNYAVNSQGQVDDMPYGGGSGMVMRPEPAVKAIEAAKSRAPNAKVIAFSPRGKPMTQQFARAIAKKTESESDRDLILLCSRYEGIDQRVLDHWVDYEVCIGDFVQMGAEVPAMAFIEACSRLLPGVLNNPESIADESFENGLLEYPQYTRPATFRDKSVPEVLLSGNHQVIADWRASQARYDTLLRRPDMLTEIFDVSCPLALALMHHPVVDKHNQIITSSLTNIDIHDIARSVRTYGLERYYIAHPVSEIRHLAERVCSHWADGFGARYNPNRTDALARIAIVEDIDDIIIDMESRHKEPVVLVTTSARPTDDCISYAKLRAELASNSQPHLIVFGTGWGLAPELLARANHRLAPILGRGDYNHLSVRSAAAIILDRLLGS